MSFAIRPMQTGDLDAVLSLAAACPEAPQWPRAAWTSYLAPDPANPALLRTGLVAVETPSTEQEEVLGVAAATLLRIPGSGGCENPCQLDSVAVLAGVRGRGIGTALLREIVVWAGRNGALRLALEVRASNAPAIALYRRFGLAQEGRRPRYYTQPEEDALLWGMPVTGGTP